jgi:hypothetical protein
VVAAEDFVARNGKTFQEGGEYDQEKLANLLGQRPLTIE